MGAGGGRGFVYVEGEQRVGEERGWGARGSLWLGGAYQQKPEADCWQAAPHGSTLGMWGRSMRKASHSALALSKNFQLLLAGN